MNGRDPQPRLSTHLNNYGGGVTSSTRSSTAIQSFLITWANSNIRAARAPSNTTHISPGLSVIASL